MSLNERSQAFDNSVNEEIFTFGAIAQEWLIKRMADKKTSYVRLEEKHEEQLKQRHA